jgi:hypothetical protein
LKSGAKIVFIAATHRIFRNVEGKSLFSARDGIRKVFFREFEFLWWEDDDDDDGDEGEEDFFNSRLVSRAMIEIQTENDKFFDVL